LCFAKKSHVVQIGSMSSLLKLSLKKEENSQQVSYNVLNEIFLLPFFPQNEKSILSGKIPD